MPKISNRVLIGLLALVVALVLAACGGGTQQTAAKATEAPKTTGGSSGALEGEAKNLTGAGATFPAPLYTRWFSDYNKLTGVKVNYQAVGSGAGIKQIQEQTVDFGASDAAMTAEQMAAAKGGAILHIPTAFGAVVLTYNLQGVDKPLNLSADTVAGIYQGSITKWNDPKIAADNAGVNLPSADIIPVYRSDGSGTTNAFTEWLSTYNADWKAQVGQGTTVKWPTGIGGNGNPGVAGEVKNNPNSIGYVELIYAIQNKLPAANIKNKAGKFVTPSLDATSTSVAAALGSLPGDLRFSVIATQPASETAYPIVTATWLLVYEKMTDKAKAVALTRVLWWATHDAQKTNTELGYAALPAELLPKVEAKIRQITVDGQPAFPGE